MSRSDSQVQKPPLRSADFGYAALPPEQPKIPGLGLPPPTQMIPIPKNVRSTESVMMSYVAEKPRIPVRFDKVRDEAKQRVRMFFSVVGDYARGINSEALGDAARTMTRYSVLGAQHSWKAMRRAYLSVRTAIDEGFELAMTESAAAPEAKVKKAWSTLACDSALRARASLTQPPVVELKEGASVTVYPNHDAPIGWVLAQSADGDIGFIPVDHLEVCTAVD